MSKHTPGPWYPYPILGEDQIDIVIAPDINAKLPKYRLKGEVVATCHGQNQRTDEANARLIAAAPEMYELLDKLKNTRLYNPGAVHELLARIDEDPK